MADALHTPGVTSAVEARLDDAGLIAVHGPGALDVRTGVMHGPGSTALVTGTADTAPMAVLVAVHHPVMSRQPSEGVYRAAVETARRVALDPAPAADARIDVIWVKQADASAGILNPDGTTELLVSKTTGAVSATPAKPAIPTGAEELATVRVAAGATATNGSGIVITNTARQTVARGAPIPVRDQAERDALAKYKGLRVIRLDRADTRVETWLGSAWGGYRNSGLLSGSTDANGFLTVAHGLGVTPRAFGADPASQVNGTLSDIIGPPRSWSADATNLTFRIYRYDTSPPSLLTGNPVSLYWWADC